VVLTRENELEHRYIAKRLLGRELRRNEVVHHINGNKTDNDLRNLCLMDREKHEYFHSWLIWKRKKSGAYPPFREQKRILEEEYGGTLLESLARSVSFTRGPSDSAHPDGSKRFKPVAPKGCDPDISKKIFDELREERKKLAAEKQLPVYIIFDNKTLYEMAETLPDTDELMLQIRGVGPNKHRMYGARFIAAIKRIKNEMKMDSKKKEDSA
jgi:superfamily II DNA helicase RecQ